MPYSRASPIAVLARLAGDERVQAERSGLVEREGAGAGDDPDGLDPRRARVEDQRLAARQPRPAGDELREGAASARPTTPIARPFASPNGSGRGSRPSALAEQRVVADLGWASSGRW